MNNKQTTKIQLVFCFFTKIEIKVFIVQGYAHSEYFSTTEHTSYTKYPPSHSPMPATGLAAWGLLEPSGIEPSVRARRSALSRGGHGLHRPFFRPKDAQNGLIQPDPPLAKPACRASQPRSLSWLKPRLPTLRPGYPSLRAGSQGTLVAGSLRFRHLGATLGQSAA